MFLKSTVTFSAVYVLMGMCIEIEKRAARKLTGQAAAADWKLLDQFAGFWWCAVFQWGTHLTRQVGTNSH